MTLRNTALALPALFVVYDFFYSLFHRALHHQTCVATSLPLTACFSGGYLDICPRFMSLCS